MAKQRETWDSIYHPQTTTLFYVGRGAMSEDKVFVSQYDEELERIGYRTVEAYNHALTLPEWNYIARPHSSTYVHKRRLVEYVETLPERDVLAGLIVPAGTYPVEWLWGGGHYILSRDVVERLMSQKNHWDHSVMEDVAVSKLAQLVGIPFTGVRSASINPSASGVGWDLLTYNGKPAGGTFTDFNEVLKADDQFHFRVKHDADRSVDLKTMDLLFKTLPP